MNEDFCSLIRENKLNKINPNKICGLYIQFIDQLLFAATLVNGFHV